MTTERIYENHPWAERFIAWQTERQLVSEVKEARAAVSRVEARRDTRGVHTARKRLRQVTARLLAHTSAS